MAVDQNTFSFSERKKKKRKSVPELNAVDEHLFFRSEDSPRDEGRVEGDVLHGQTHVQGHDRGLRLDDGHGQGLGRLDPAANHNLERKKERKSCVIPISN